MNIWTRIGVTLLAYWPNVRRWLLRWVLRAGADGAGRVRDRLDDRLERDPLGPPGWLDDQLQRDAFGAPKRLDGAPIDDRAGPPNPTAASSRGPR